MTEELFEVVSAQEWETLQSHLTERQRRLVVAAIRYHSLINPGRELEYQIALGRSDQYPRISDGSTLDGVLAGDAEASLGTVRAKGVARHSTDFPLHYLFGDDLVPDPNKRFILVTPDDATDADVQAKWHKAPAQRVYDFLEERSPAVLDVAREALTVRRERHLDDPIEARELVPAAVLAEKWGIRRPVRQIDPAPSGEDARPAVIVGMHWLQTGGAERWAVETIAEVKAAGLLPIVITDHDSQSPWITRPELDDCIVLPLTFPSQERLGDEPLLRAIVEHYDLRGVLVHHCQWLYDRLPWIKRYRPTAVVIDSLHIIEHYGGGFPTSAVHEDAFIDMHHVISPQLRDWLVRVHHVRSDKVVLAPLLGLTVNEHSEFKSREADEPFTIAFVGRLARQKRPDTFLMMASVLQKRFPQQFRFILHGDGELDRVASELIRRYQLQNSIEWRRSDVPVGQTFADSDLLVITSRNEGITLTSLEAIAAGVPVLSAHVGSQESVIPAVALLPRQASLLTRRVAKIVTRLMQDDSLRKRIWEAEKQLTQRLDSYPKASDWMSKEVSSWA